MRAAVALHGLLAAIALAAAAWLSVSPAYPDDVEGRLGVLPLPPTGSSTISRLSPTYVQDLSDAELERALDLCFQYSAPTGMLLGCLPYDRMCNRAYQWVDECRRVETRWRESGAVQRAEMRRQVQERLDHAFVLKQAR